MLVKNVKQAALLKALSNTVMCEGSYNSYWKKDYWQGLSAVIRYKDDSSWLCQKWDVNAQEYEIVGFLPPKGLPECKKLDSVSVSEMTAVAVVDGKPVEFEDFDEEFFPQHSGPVVVDGLEELEALLKPLKSVQAQQSQQSQQSQQPSAQQVGLGEVLAWVTKAKTEELKKLLKMIEVLTAPDSATTTTTQVSSEPATDQ